MSLFLSGWCFGLAFVTAADGRYGGAALLGALGLALLASALWSYWKIAGVR